jgi:hypothetical protein
MLWHICLCGLGLSQENQFAKLSILGDFQTMMHPSLVDASQYLGAASN